MTYLSMTDVDFRYRGSKPWQLQNFSLAVKEGENVAIVGPSGCAKTTVLRLLAGLERPLAGSITLQGDVLSGEGVFVDPEKRGVGMVFQDYALFPHLSVLTNVTYGLKGRPRKERAESAREVLEMVGMAVHAHKYPHQLSGGQQQRVALARSLAPRPRLLLLDEPFSNLDAGLRTSIRADVREILKASGATSILVTHDEEDAVALSCQMVRMAGDGST